LAQRWRYAKLFPDNPRSKKKRGGGNCRKLQQNNQAKEGERIRFWSAIERSRCLFQKMHLKVAGQEDGRRQERGYDAAKEAGFKGQGDEHERQRLELDRLRGAITL